jgi:L-ornithine N5-oxygenase
MAPSAIINPSGPNLATNGSDGTSHANRPVNGTLFEAPPVKLQQPSHISPDVIFDLVCVGFGPASLAIATALHDAYKTSLADHPKVLFLEKQAEFAWHAGMQLPGAKMQISFLKDLATPRDPTSKFTFLNYLFQKGRLHNFINLGTFLPSRMEYEDYLRWCATFFENEGSVEYGMEVKGVSIGEKSEDGKVSGFVVTATNQAGEAVSRRARRVVIAVGGQPIIPSSLQGLKHVHHSSQFANEISKIQENDGIRPLKFAVIGGGQSAAEIFNDIWSRFPGAQV